MRTKLSLTLQIIAFVLATASATSALVAAGLNEARSPEATASTVK